MEDSGVSRGHPVQPSQKPPPPLLQSQPGFSPKCQTPRGWGCGWSPPSSCQRGQPGLGKLCHCGCSRMEEAAWAPCSGTSSLQPPAAGGRGRAGHSMVRSVGPAPPLSSKRSSTRTGSHGQAMTGLQEAKGGPSLAHEGRQTHLVAGHGEDIAEASATDVVRDLRAHQEGMQEGGSAHGGHIRAASTRFRSSVIWSRQPRWKMLLSTPAPADSQQAHLALRAKLPGSTRCSPHYLEAGKLGRKACSPPGVFRQPAPESPKQNKGRN